MSARELITEHLDLWTGAVTQKATRGRGSNGKIEFTGVKKLRELILQLAVEGKLVRQDSSQKPASELLQAAADEKAQALKDKKIRKSQLGDTGADISESGVPKRWAFTTLSTIGYWAIGNGFPKAHQGETGREVLFCKVSDMNLPENSREIHTTVNSVSEQTAHSLKLNIHSSGTVIFPKIGGAIATNKRRVIVKPTAIDNNCLGIIPTCATSSDYLYLFLTSVDMTQYQVGTSVPALSQGTLGKIPVKLPPLKEQHRIVQKVDELMALCDRLEQQTGDQFEAHETLVDTLLGTLTQSENATELADNWARLAAHFDTLFTTEKSIDKLKQAVLQLAVMGRLVEQNLGNQSAAQCLQQISENKEELVRQGIISKTKSLPSILKDQEPFQIPANWAWVRVWDVVDLITSGSRGWAKFYSETGASFITMGNLSRGTYNLRLKERRFVNPPNNSEGSRTKLQKGDLVVSITGDVGNLGLIPPNFGEAYINQHSCLVRFNEICRNRYMAEYMRSPLAKWQFDAPQRGIKNSFRLGDLGEMMLPLPPLEEQHRIVQKVDELMALCDQLKERLNQASETRCQLAEAVVDKALN